MRKMFCETFNELLKKNNINPFKLAKQIGVPKSIVYEWKYGEREPSVENILKLSEYFGVSVEYLTGRTTAEENEENELILMLRTAREISRDDYEMLLSDFKKSIDAYIRSGKEKKNDKN